MDIAELTQPPLFLLKPSKKAQCIISTQRFIAILPPARDHNIESRRLAGNGAVGVDSGKLHIGGFIVLEIKLAHKLAFHQVGELIGESFQALFVCPGQQMKIITKRKQDCRYVALWQVLRIYRINAA